MALEMQSRSKNEPDALGGGKGILIQNERTGALSTLNNQSVFVDVYNQEITGQVAASLTAACGGTNTSGAKVLARKQSAVIPIHDKATRFQGGGPTRNGDGAGNGLGIGNNGDPCPALSTADKHMVFDARGNGG